MMYPRPTNKHQIAFLIPFRTDHGYRDSLFHWVVDRIRVSLPTCGVYVGESGKGEFNRSAAINNAFSQTKGEPIVVINDADTIWNPSTIMGGLYSVLYEARFVIPYTSYHLLDQASTERLTKSRPHVVISNNEYSYENVIHPNPDVYHAPPVSGVVMMKSEDFEDVGGFDDRFVGWGEEDVAFVIKANKKLGKPLRLENSVYHLWHPRGKDYAQPNYQKNQKLLRREYL